MVDSLPHRQPAPSLAQSHVVISQAVADEIRRRAAIRHERVIAYRAERMRNIYAEIAEKAPLWAGSNAAEEIARELDKHPEFRDRMRESAKKP